MKVSRRMALSIMALCPFTQGASAATISITKEVFTRNAPLADTPSPALQSGNLLQRMTGSLHHFAISPYAFNTGPGPGGSAAATNAPYSVLNAGGGRLSSATYNVNSSSFTLLWGTPSAENQIAFYTGQNGTGSLINVIGGETTFYNGSNLPCYISGCRGRFDLVTFTVSNGNIGSVVLSDRGGGSFEYNIVSPAVVAELKASKRPSNMSPEEAVVNDFVTELTTNHDPRLTETPLLPSSLRRQRLTIRQRSLVLAQSPKGNR